MIFECKKGLLTEALQDEEFARSLFEDKFNQNYMSFWSAFKAYANRKEEAVDDNLAYEFLSMVDMLEDRMGTISYCWYDKMMNKFLFYNRTGDVIAECDCKDGLVAVPVRKNKFDLNEDLNENNQVQISFTLVVKYESENPDIKKEDIEDYSEQEEECINQYQENVLGQVEENKKFINEVMGTYDFQFEYGGYDDDFNIYFILTTEKDDILNETILKAFKRSFDSEVQYEFDVDGSKVLLTATPFATLNSDFTIEPVDSKG